jgi:hypothetical protein
MRGIIVGAVVVGVMMWLGATRADAGVLMIYSSPPGAQVAIDGKPTPLKTPAMLDLAPGIHKVTLYKSGYVLQDRKVKIAPGNNQRMQVTLPFTLDEGGAKLPKGTFTGTGNLTVSTKVPGAAIRINGRDLKLKTPATFAIKSGYYVVQLSRPKASLARAVVISPNKTTKVQVKLAPSKAARSRPRSRSRAQRRAQTRPQTRPQTRRPKISEADWPAYRDACLKRCRRDDYIPACDARLSRCVGRCPGVVAGKVVNPGAYYSCADLCKNSRTYCLDSGLSTCKKRCNTR